MQVRQRDPCTAVGPSHAKLAGDTVEPCYCLCMSSTPVLDAPKSEAMLIAAPLLAYKIQIDMTHRHDSSSSVPDGDSSAQASRRRRPTIPPDLSLEAEGRPSGWETVDHSLARLEIHHTTATLPTLYSPSLCPIRALTPPRAPTHPPLDARSSSPTSPSSLLRPPSPSLRLLQGDGSCEVQRLRSNTDVVVDTEIQLREPHRPSIRSQPRPSIISLDAAATDIWVSGPLPCLQAQNP
nr:hypothetical protein CFP56_64170 [Quercus suber]